MGWIKVEQSLLTHYKTYILAEQLHIRQSEAVGILVGLWCWALDNVNEDGNMPYINGGALGVIVGFYPKPERNIDLLFALETAGFIEKRGDNRGFYIHDWEDFGGRCIAEQNAYRERMKKARERQKRFRDAHTTDNSNATVTRNEAVTIEDNSNATIECLDETRQDKTRQDKNNIHIPSRATAKKTENEEQEVAFEAFWLHYPKKNDKQNAKKAFLKLNPDSELRSKMIIAVDKQKMSSQWKEDGGRYIPYGATWINGRRWEDEVTEQTEKTSGSFKTDEFFAKAQARAEKVMRGGETV